VAISRNGETASLTTTFTHTPVISTTTKGAVVMVSEIGVAGSLVTGVTYGGAAMTLIDSEFHSGAQGVAVSTWFLGVGLGQGNQSVVVSVSGAPSVGRLIVCATMAALADTVLVTNANSNGSGVQAALAQDSASVVAQRYSVIASDTNTDLAILTGCSGIGFHQFPIGGPFDSRSGMLAQTSPASGNFTIGYSGTTPGFAFAALTIKEGTIPPPALNIAHDAITTSGEKPTSIPFNFTHTPVNTPRGVVVMCTVYEYGASGRTVQAVSYGGVPLTRVSHAEDVTTEFCMSEIWFLGSGVPTGAQTVTVTPGGAALGTTIVAVAATITATTNVEVVAQGVVQDNIADPSVALDSGSSLAIRYAVLTSGNRTATPTVLTGMTAGPSGQFITNVDTTRYNTGYQTTASSGVFSIGWIVSIDDVALAAVAIREIPTPPVPIPPPVPSAQFLSQRDTVSRFHQLVMELNLISCQNAYAQPVSQWLTFTDAFDNAAWTKSGGTTVLANSFVGPDPDDTVAEADKIVFAAAGDTIKQTTTGSVVTSKTFTGSVWLRDDAGGTLTLTLRNAGNTESKTLVVTVTSTWKRFAIFMQFSGTPVDAVEFEIKRDTADIAQVGAWRANVSQNPSNNNRVDLFPTVKRTSEAVSVVAVQASRCQAADAGVGKRCWYSPPTCQDSANFNSGHSYEDAPLDGFRRFTFCRTDVPLPVAGEEFLPMIEDASFAGQEIFNDKAVTVKSETTVTLGDDTPRSVWNDVEQQRGHLVNSGIPSGSFWKRFRTIYRNFSNPKNFARLLEGFVSAGATVADLFQKGTYSISTMVITPRGATIKLLDPLDLLITKAPATINDDNVLIGGLSAGTTSVTVTNSLQLTPLPRAGSLYPYPVVIEIDFGTGSAEFCTVTANDTVTNTISVLRGRWGTTAVTHAPGAKWREVLMLGTENATPASPPTGKNAVTCVLELLHRGFGDLDGVDIVSFEQDRDLYVPDILFKRAGPTIGSANAGIADSQDIEKLLNSIREVAQIDIWTSAAQVLKGSVFGPIRPTTDFASLNDTSGLIADSITVDENEITRINKVIIHYGLRTDKAGTEVIDFTSHLAYLDADSLREDFDGKARTLSIFCPWIIANDTATATTLAARLFTRFRKPLRKVLTDVELKDDEISVGDYVLFSSDEIQNPDGTGVTNRKSRVLRKEYHNDSNAISMLLQDEDLLQKFSFISGDADTTYDAATTTQRLYAFVADDFGLVGSDRVPGNYIW
jgi:hypothetical protein